MPNNSDNKLRLAVNNFLHHWHTDFVIDYWWRKKYNVPFGSEQHRQMSWIDMYIEYCEDKKIKELREREENEQFSIPDSEPMTQQEIDEDFENINLEDFNNA